ncbi:MAG: aminotransferase class V-fold PLP-dependent enzyme, partial [bacterium]|nr:aminotransferase class V-fold PLP-dependent enzyme [bacterium]
MRIKNIRKQFPILSKKINGHPLAYFDNAATTQKPQSVIDAVADFYAHSNANVHRGIHTLSQEATEKFEAVREKVRKFLNAASREEIIFTSGATESLNLVARGLRDLLKAGDEIILSEAEHHSNIVPWQVLAQEKHLKIKYIPLTSEGRLDQAVFKKLLNKKTKIVSITAASNVTGAITPLRAIIPAAHKVGAMVVVDAAQAAAHLPINVQKLDCDFLAFSGHKIYGPTGIGVLYGKKTLLEKLTPWKFGGNMVAEVTKNRTTLAEIPERLEGGTPPIAEVAGLGAAIEFLNILGRTTVHFHGREICKYALKRLKDIEGLRLLGPSASQ